MRGWALEVRKTATRPFIGPPDVVAGIMQDEAGMTNAVVAPPTNI
jgi:hypothetical protein